MCDNPGCEHDGDHDAFYDRVRETIERSGQNLVGVMDSSGGFVYTIGNHQHGLPELLATDCDPRKMGGVLNLLGRMQRERGRAFADGELVDLGGKVPVKAIVADSRGREEYAIQAVEYYGGAAVRVVQILVPDPEGRFPGEPGCLEPYASQTVLRGR